MGLCVVGCSRAGGAAAGGKRGPTTSPAPAHVHAGATPCAAHACGAASGLTRRGRPALPCASLPHPAEEGFLADARRRHDELSADLEGVRGELAAFLERRAALDRACHDVLTAQERDRDQALTDAHVDARIR